MNRLRGLSLGVGLALATTSCAGGGDGAQQSGSRPTAPTSTPEATTPPTTSAETTTTTAAPTTLPRPLAVAIEQVAEIPGRALTSPFSDGPTIVAASETDTGRFMGDFSVVRLDGTGGVIQEVPVAAGDAIHRLAHTPDATFAYGSFVEPGYPYGCGLRALDPSTLTLGPTIQLPTDNGCGGPIVADDVHPGTLLVTDATEPIVFRVDTLARTVTSISLQPAVPPEDYWIRDIVALRGNTYAFLVADFDPVTGTDRTAPDGTALQPLIARIDGASGTVTAAPVSGRFVVDAGRLVVRLDETTAQVIDPLTLASTDVAASAIVVPDDELGSIGDIGWSYAIDDAGVLVVELRDPTTELVTSEAHADTGFGADQFIGADAVTVGDEMYLVVTQQTRTSGGPTMSTTKLFRATLHPAS